MAVAMRLYYVHPVNAGVAPGTNSGVNCDALPQQWMTANTCMDNNSLDINGFQATISPVTVVQQPMAQQWANVGPVGVPMMCSIGQTPQDAVAFAPAFPTSATMQNTPSSVPMEFQQTNCQPPQDVVFAPAFTNSVTMQYASPSMSAECQQANEDEANETNRSNEFIFGCSNSYLSDDLSATVRSQRQRDRGPDAVTSEEIEEMRLAVQNTMSRLQHMGSSGGFEVSQHEDVTCAKHSYKPNECDNDALSSVSSTSAPESRIEYWADAVDDDVESNSASRKSS